MLEANCQRSCNIPMLTTSTQVPGWNYDKTEKQKNLRSRAAPAASILKALLVLLEYLEYPWALFFWQVYVFAVLFTQTVNTAVSDMDTSSPELHDVKRYFGNLVNTMLSLFMSIAGGVSWEAVITPLGFISPLWALLFLFYISPLGLHVCVFLHFLTACNHHWSNQSSGCLNHHFGCHQGLSVW